MGCTSGQVSDAEKEACLFYDLYLFGGRFLLWF
jgi:hypothetical protein